MSDWAGRPEVVLANGTILHADVGISSGGKVMWIWLRDREDPHNNLAELIQALDSSEATATISRVQNGQVREYTGYTRLTSVRIYREGLGCARLEKEETDVYR